MATALGLALEASDLLVPRSASASLASPRGIDLRFQEVGEQDEDLLAKETDG